MQVCICMLRVDPCLDIIIVQHVAGIMNVLCDLCKPHRIRCGNTLDLNFDNFLLMYSMHNCQDRCESICTLRNLVA